MHGKCFSWMRIALYHSTKDSPDHPIKAAKKLRNSTGRRKLMAMIQKWDVHSTICISVRKDTLGPCNSIQNSLCSLLADLRSFRTIWNFTVWSRLMVHHWRKNLAVSAVLAPRFMSYEIKDDARWVISIMTRAYSEFFDIRSSSKYCFLLKDSDFSLLSYRCICEATCLDTEIRPNRMPSKVLRLQALTPLPHNLSNTLFVPTQLCIESLPSVFPVGLWDLPNA